MKYSSEQIDAIAARLREMPAMEKRNPNYSKQQAVGLLIKEITALQKRGYTLAQIAEALRGGGMDIATPTLKNYLRRTKPARKRTPAPSTKPETVLGKAKAGGKPASFSVTSDTDDI